MKTTIHFLFSLFNISPQQCFFHGIIRRILVSQLLFCRNDSYALVMIFVVVWGRNSLASVTRNQLRLYVAGFQRKLIFLVRQDIASCTSQGLLSGVLKLLLVLHLA